MTGTNSPGENRSSAMNNRVLQLDPRDNVLIALSNLSKGERVTFGGQSYVLGSDVRAKHKFATQDFPTGADIVMYGVLVGKAVEPIRRGELLTTRNVHHEAAPFRDKLRDYAGGRRTFPNGSERRFAVIADPMARWERATIGWLCRWFFARTETSEY